MESFVSGQRIGAIGAVFFGALAVFACSTAPATPTCDPAKCLPGNECIAAGSETKCRLVCASHGDCPTNYKCQTGGAKSYCAPDTLQITAKSAGQWGYRCNPQNGLESGDCDGEQGFKCHAKSPTDGDAYCTRYACAKDTDCRSGWYCGAVRKTPNADSSEASWGVDVRVCLPQDFCAPCASDLDCSQKGHPTYCVAGTDSAKFCATECADDTACDHWAGCKAAPNGKNVCTPLAGVCKGDGQYCSPCRSDSDCKAGGGACLQADLGTNEKFCSGVSAVDCTKDGNGRITKAECPTPQIKPTPYYGCENKKNLPTAPFNACWPYVQFGKDEDAFGMGCWTRNYYKAPPPPADAGVDAGVDAAADAASADASTSDAQLPTDATIMDVINPVIDASAD